MATAKLYNLARMSTATTGTGTITLGSAATGFISFATAGIADGDVVTYAIEDGNNREIGRGTYTASGTTLTRSVLKSTNAGSAINLSGSAQVFITNAAEDHIAGPSASVDNELVLFSGTGGATLKRASSTGILKATSGVIGTATASTDYAPATSGSAILKGNGSGGFSSAAAGTDYAAATSGSSILKGNGSGGFSSAAAGTDYCGATSGSSVLKGSSGNTTAATAGTDYMKPDTTSVVSAGFTLTPANIGTFTSTQGTTVTPANGNYQYVSLSGSFTWTLTAPASDCAVDILVSLGASGSGVTVAFSGFKTPGSGAAGTFTAANSTWYVLSVRRINSVSTYSWSGSWT